MVVNDSKKLPKVAQNFCCEICDYNTSKKSSYVKHLSTDKHKINENDSKWIPKHANKLSKVAHPNYNCECGKNYKYDSGFYRHKKKCSILNKEPILDKDSTDKELIIELLKQNNYLIEVIKNGSNNIINSNNTNSNNKTFNLNFFLNETCKDAMNIMEFVDSIKLQLSDLEKVGEIGYVEGISNIITTNLKALDITQRPIHCTDKKREILYVKDEDKWEKDDERNKIKKVIKRISNKNIKLLSEFKEEHPDYGKSESKISDKYNNLVIESMGGIGDNMYEKENKIIHNITKIVTIEK